LLLPSHFIIEPHRNPPKVFESCLQQKAVDQ
jgi:hypothetical protein